ncbi:phospholipase C/P1 nuclease family protein [Parachitinimonas caeni]|uniref:Phospholipase n=1 Tax=Parachitinimonas caeni TaxID=3031301 RepID=A0ABT7E1A9_9NEIS|nr:phospholipase [Parachitinimonas caeni]MDK2126111.1 phospholipase [Parachitinimonas caeni]
MKQLSRSALALAVLSTLCASGAQAFTQETHRRIAMDAVTFMKANPGSTNYNKLVAGLTRAGYTVEQFAQAIGQGAYDVDDFADTYLCGATTGDCQMAPVWGLGASIVKYTSYFHFQNHTAGPDVHGNDIGGYNYHKLTVWGDIDKMAAGWLYGDHMDDGAGGMKGWFGDGSKYNTYGITEAHYRLGGKSTPDMYADFEKMPFQPIDNLAQYWWQQFLAQPTAQTLGFVMHSTDLLQPHHTWTTSAKNHSGWESWVNDYYYSEGFNDQALVKAAMTSFTPLAPNAVDIRPLLTQGGAFSYSQGGIVLSSTDHNDRKVVARKVVPHAIAMVVHLLNRAAERF